MHLIEPKLNPIETGFTLCSEILKSPHW